MASGISKSRIDRYLQVIKLFGELVSKDFRDLVKDDFVSLIAKIESRHYSNWTKYTYKSMLRKFVSWVHDSKEAPDCISWVKLNSCSSRRLPEELLTQDEVKLLIESAVNIRDKALISSLYESGCRISEIGNLRIKNLSFDKYGARFIVNGKTGQRRVRVIASVHYLAEWLNNHPRRDEPESPLWVSLRPNKGMMLNYAMLCSIIKRIAVRAGIKKKVNPHSFRHARATHLCNYLTEAQMKEYFGWVQGSKMASVYIHLSGRDVDKALLKINGIKPDDEGDSDSMSIINCPRCEFSNSPTNKYCGKCGMLLSIKAGMQLENEERSKDELLNELIKDPEVKALLVEKAKVIMRR